jgi:hypothetical protein
VLFGRHGYELIPGARDEVGKLHLCDWSHAHEGRPSAAPDDRDLGAGRVDHAPLTELLLQPASHRERSAERADVLAYQEDPFVSKHLRAKAVGDRLEIGEFWHQLK